VALEQARADHSQAHVRATPRRELVKAVAEVKVVNVVRVVQ
jgi:hypothetical protein